MSTTGQLVGRECGLRSNPHRRPVLLAVDDEPDTLTLLQVCLSAAGFEVMTARTAAEALQLIAGHRPDLILTDLMMPGITGLELCRTLRARRETRDIPIIVHSGSELPEDNCGLFDRYVLKPAAPGALARLVRRLLADRRA